MKFLKYLIIILIVLAIIAFIAIKVISDPLPEGKSGSDADKWVQQIQTKLNRPAYDTLAYLKWEFFRPGQKYLWDKQRNLAVIEWAGNKAIMNLTSQVAITYADGVQQEGDAHEALKQKAWSNWCNDSFWMFAPFKMNDPGTSREIVELEEGGKGLKISYSDGGVTPGDSYVWMIGDDNVPTGYRMWTSIIPVQGMYSGWSGWESHKGVLLSTKHDLLGKEVEMSGVAAGHTLEEVGYSNDPFAQLMKG